MSPAAGRVRDLSGSLARKKAAARRRTLIRIALGAVTLGVVGLLVWLVAFSSVFAVSRVEVSGVSLVSTEAVAEKAAVPLGTPLVRLDMKAIKGRVAALPPVKTVEVSRRLPNTVAIVVTERSPVYALALPGAFQLVDEDGVAFAPVLEKPAGLVPVTITNPTARLQADAATVVRALPADVRPATTGIEVHSADRVIVQLEGGRQVVWGSSEQSALKATVLSALLKTKATVYDVSSPSHPATR